MKKKITIISLLSVIIITLGGCVKAMPVDRENPEIPEAKENPLKAEENADESENISDKESLEDGAISESANADVKEGIVYRYGEISLTFPGEWENRYVIEEHSDGNGFSVIQKASYDIDGSGNLFSIWSSNEPAYDLPGGYPIAYNENTMWFVGYPTDVPFVYDNEEVAKDYNDMCEQLVQVESTIVINGDCIHPNADEYVLPMSEYYLLREDMLWNLSAEQLMLARNEIYARHGYKFKNEFLNLYFDRFSWYQGDGERFEESQLSEIERANADLIKEMEARFIYPIEYSADEVIRIDLDEDGTEEKIKYRVDGYTGYFEINGLTYDLCDLDRSYYDPDEERIDIILFEPDIEHFYISDVSQFAGKELIITDDGPSDDPISYFFAYKEGELKYAGSVPGYPMPQKTGINRMVTGGVTGYTRGDFIETYDYFVYYWYNSETDKLEYQESDYHVILPGFPKELTMDLQVYTNMDVNASTLTLEAQPKVFFLETDAKEWLLIRGKDGTEGYVHLYEDGSGRYMVDGVNKPAEEVFLGLRFYD